MNEYMQELIIKEVGIIGIISLIGTIIVTCIFPDNTIAVTVLFGAVTSVVSGLFTFLNGKNVTDKEKEILEQTIKENIGGGDDVQ